MSSGHSVPSVLFLCTYNFYRSRMAEALLRYLQPNIQVESRAIRQDLINVPHQGNISIYSTSVLSLYGVTPTQDPSLGRKPVSVTAEELETYDIVIAVDRREHEPMIQNQFAEFANKVHYFDVPDVEIADPIAAVSKLTYEVCRLHQSIKPSL